MVIWAVLAVLVVTAAPVVRGNNRFKEVPDMKGNKLPSVVVCNAVCVLLLAVLLVLQFTPFWELDGQQISIGSYIWFPTEHSDLTGYIQEETVNPDYRIDSLVLPSIVQLVIPAAGIFLFLYNREGIFVQICAAVSGLVGIWSFLCKPAFRLGTIWYVHLILVILLLIAGIVSLVIRKKHIDLEREEV